MRSDQNRRSRPAWHSLRLALALLATTAPAAMAQDRAIETEAIRPGITVLRSHPDGNVLVVRGRAGVLVVDALSPELAERADSAIRAAADGSAPRWVVSTHYHADHLGANGRLAAAGAMVLAHSAVPDLARRDTTIAELDWDLDPADPALLPARTIEDSLTIDLGDDVARVIHLPAAHTAGDLVVRIERANVLHTGDIVEFGAYPFIDHWAGGSFDGVVAAVDRLLELADGETTIVPGHGRLLARADLLAYREMLRTVGTRVRAGLRAGRSADELAAENITAPWDPEHGGARHGQRFVRLLILELSGRDRNDR